MTNEELEVLENYCKLGWTHLTNTGEHGKPKNFRHFKHYCPACEIAKRTDDILKTSVNSYKVPCEYCPITIWRELRNNLMKEYKSNYRRCEFISEEPMCEWGDGFYKKWRLASQHLNPNAIRKFAASNIALLEWTYIPEYDTIEVSDLIEFINQNPNVEC